MTQPSEEKIKKEFFKKCSEEIKTTGKVKIEDVNWSNYFLMLKRWYYRLRDYVLLSEDDCFIGKSKMEDDYFWTSIILCYHLKDWLISCKVAEKKEIENYINENESLSICADICNSSKHGQLNKAGHCRTNDYETRIANLSFEAEYKNKKGFIPMTFIFNNGKMIDAYDLLDNSMQAWGKFIVSKNLEIPEFKEENTKTGFIKWKLKE